MSVAEPAARDCITLGRDVTFSDVAAVARGDLRVELAPDARARMERSRAHIRALANGERPVYGVTTGFGALANERIPPAARADLQHRLVRSHAAGMGPPIEREVVRAMILLRSASLARGYAGARPEIVDALLGLLNNDITPVVPAHGSLGASGDLAPLAHVACAILGEGIASYADGRTVRVEDALREANLRPVVLEEKEGVSLINGTDGMLGQLVLACVDAEVLFRTADVACAMSVEALNGTDAPFRPEAHTVRPHPGQAKSAANLRKLLAGSGIIASHRDSDHAVQDAYSLRCHPQVIGAARDTLDFAEQVATRELASAVDNPIVLADGRLQTTGNFHGEPLAFACDFLAIASAEVGSIAERRVDRLLDPSRSDGLPAFLGGQPGLDSGLMIAQYTAAALVAENRRLAAPASVDSIPTSAMQEDHVSMGWGAARKLRISLQNLTRIIAVEALTATYGQWWRAPAAAPATAAVRDLILRNIPSPGPDRMLAPHLAVVEDLCRAGRILAAAENVNGGALL